MASDNPEHIAIRVKRTSGLVADSRQLRIEPTSVDLRGWSHLADESVANQKQTFSRWINEQLRKHAVRRSPSAGKTKKTSSGSAKNGLSNSETDGNVYDNDDTSRENYLRVDDIEQDLRDGVVLIKLIEALSGKRIHRANRSANLQRTQKLDNVTTVLKRLEEDGIRLVNINTTDIVDGNLKLILGLIWTLIRYYSIAKARWNAAQTRPNAEVEADVDSDASARKRLLQWINDRLPSGFRVRNFDSDWTDGRAVCALVNACVPGSFVEWNLVGPGNARDSVHRALDIADEQLGIAKVFIYEKEFFGFRHEPRNPCFYRTVNVTAFALPLQLIEPDEMLTPAIDERVMMTYLAQFPNAHRVVPEQSPRDDAAQYYQDDSEPTYLNADAVRPVQRERADPRALFDEYASHSHSNWRPLRDSELRPPSSFEPEVFRVVRKRPKNDYASDVTPNRPELPVVAEKYKEQLTDGDGEQLYDTFKLFEHVDEHAISVSQIDHSSFRDLIWQLIYARDIQDDLEKVRVLFMWLCTKDLSKLHFDTVLRDSPEEKLLQIRDGQITYTEVFELLCSYAGIQCEVVHGYVKTHPYVPGMRVSDVLDEPSSNDADSEDTYENPSESDSEYANSSARSKLSNGKSSKQRNGSKVGDVLRSRWNTVLIHGTWQLVDCNWAARSLVLDESAKNKHKTAPRQSVVSSSMLHDTSRIKYRLHTFYFLPNPTEFLYSHFPDRPEWQLVDSPMSLTQYEDLPWLRSAFFQFGLELRSACSAFIETSRSEVEIVIGQKYAAQSETVPQQPNSTSNANLSVNGTANSPDGCPMCLSERMQFTFSFWFASGLDTYHGYPLWHYVMNEYVNYDRDILFRIRLPLTNEPCRLTIYAKLLHPDPAIPNSDEFRAICEFTLVARSSPPSAPATPAPRDSQSSRNRYSLPPDAGPRTPTGRSGANRNSVQPSSPPLQPVLPFPPCRDCLYGPSPLAKRLGLRLSQQSSNNSSGDVCNFLHVQDGTADLRLTSKNNTTQFSALRFRAKLKAHSSVTSTLPFALDRFVVVRVAPRFNEVRVSVFLPQTGEYALELFILLASDVAQPVSDDAYRLIWRFMLVAARPSAFSEVLPPLPPDLLLGTVYNVATNLNIVSLNQMDPFVSRTHFNENEITLKLTSGLPIRTSVQLLRYSRRSPEPLDFSGFVLQQQTLRSSAPLQASTISGLSSPHSAAPSPPQSALNVSQVSNQPFGSSASLIYSEVELNVRLPRPGFYVLKLFAQPLTDSSPHLLNVFNYLLCTLSPATSHTASSPFPKQSTRWLEGCYLFQPVSERIVAARMPKGSVWFKLIVPGASVVCVVIGDVWRALEKRMETWLGEVNLYRILPKRDPNRLVICASFDEQREQYHTLLEYTVE